MLYQKLRRFEKDMPCWALAATCHVMDQRNKLKHVADKHRGKAAIGSTKPFDAIILSSAASTEPVNSCGRDTCISPGRA